ncbi:hypothetical protein BN938_1835 [Mucinivorans hirudinis]|uniref:Uncharacterized protein n=1 Tax=Mucinivorans hirudinis TaxID=1433126 RepID=A0A060R8R2_9BACT|nr:hypothetical protein BN938_1835 [Mucinivorans hirudinis]
MAIDYSIFESKNFVSAYENVYTTLDKPMAKSLPILMQASQRRF